MSSCFVFFIFQDPRCRLNVAQCLQHPFLKQNEIVKTEIEMETEIETEEFKQWYLHCFFYMSILHIFYVNFNFCCVFKRDFFIVDRFLHFELLFHGRFMNSLFTSLFLY